MPTLTDNVGQTGGDFLTRYKEHLRSSRTNNSKSGIAQHLIDNNHAMGSTEKTMKMLHISKAGPYLYILVLERFYIFRGSKIEAKLQTYGIYIHTHDQPLFLILCQSERCRYYLANITTSLLCRRCMTQQVTKLYMIY